MYKHSQPKLNFTGSLLQTGLIKFVLFVHGSECLNIPAVLDLCAGEVPAGLTGSTPLLSHITAFLVSISKT